MSELVDNPLISNGYHANHFCWPHKDIGTAKMKTVGEVPTNEISGLGSWTNMLEGKKNEENKEEIKNTFKKNQNCSYEINHIKS